MIRILIVSTLTLLAFSREGQTAEHTSPPLNIIFILVDDLGWADLGCYGSTFYETPHIDKLAKSGLRFTNAYAACPVCSPTRASILTGKYPARLGLTDHTGGPQPGGWNRPTKLKPAKFKNWLPLEECTLAESLHDAGYATFIAGKWHLGHNDNYWPEYQGFDINMGGWAQGGPFGGKQYFPPYGNPRLPDGPPGEHLPDRLAEETVRFIESHRHKPFFAFLSFYSVHVPLSAREDLRQKYEQKRNLFPDPQTPTFDFDGETRVRQTQDHAVYAAMVDAMDQAVGKVLASVDRLGLEDRTLVIFTSDNGGLSTGDRGISKDQGWPTSNLPLRMGKGWLYEGGIRVPLIVRMPRSSVGGKTDHVVTSTDFYPTLQELCKVPTDGEQHHDGTSFAKVLAGESVERGPVFWHYPHYSNQGGAPGAAVRDGPWKLIHWFEDDSVELYNLNDDIREKHNLAESKPEVRDQLKAQLDRWHTDVGAVMPTPNVRIPVAKMPADAFDAEASSRSR